MIDLQNALLDRQIMLYATFAGVTAFSIADVIRATIAPDYWQRLGDRSRVWAMDRFERWRERRSLVHDHTDTLSKHALKQLKLKRGAPGRRIVLPASQPDIPMPPVQQRAPA